MSERANTPSARTLRLLLHLVTRGRITTAQASRLLGIPPRRARDDLKLVASVAPVAIRGLGRDRAWVLDPAAGLGRLGVLDRISLCMGREVAAFLEGTALHEGLARADADGWEGVADRWSAHLDRKFRHLQEPARAYGVHREVLDAAIDALLRERLVDFDYTRGGRTVPYRGFRPLTLVVYRRAVYLLGRTPEAPNVLRLSIDRMRDARVGDPFAYPDDWDPDADLGRFFGIVASGTPDRVVLRFTPQVARLVWARAWHPTAQMTALPDGGVELSMVTGGQELVRFALEWGATCEVVAPPWLRDAVLAELRGALAAYGAPEAATTPG
jgi:predicted DNA-binding transcriptional regulator YafY